MDNKCQSFPSELSRWVSGNQNDVGWGGNQGLRSGRLVRKLSFEALELLGGLGISPQASSSGKEGTIALSTCGLFSLTLRGRHAPPLIRTLLRCFRG